MVILMVGIGGFTRLTKSGLSITEWKPVTGILLPLNDQDWIKEKSKYESTPEYKAFNYDISMKEFQVLYLIEYIHRLIGRLTGLIFILPFIYFILKNTIPKKVIIRLSIVLLLGILQAFAGWYMVKSGLDNTPHVSHYRLALHLLLALVIFALLLNQFFDYFIKPEQKKIKISNIGINSLKAILIVTIIQVIFGAFVAGLNAGLIYNTFPLMEGKIIPDDLFFLHPIWLNFFEHRVTVQFIHRMLAFLILILTIVLTIKNRNIKSLFIMLMCIIIQIILGVVTLLCQVPVPIAVLHQVFAFIFLASGLYSLHSLRKE